ncbi:Primosomal protein N' [Lacunisphaera limnophila]|uniref:Replication restart protein PriA n=1 Tax=Lacunisphaera limnophila TaxID=1838286 RepID=A0A1D8AXB7_9BACT|nr:primosomal protein N' [Lacunisphaera limnophila]AOS45520.1 Primosomal protein N' [Lacunisphaera limnophila]
MIVGVQPLAGFDKLLHYKVPEHLRAEIHRGSLVRVPILNRPQVGLVLEADTIADVPVERLKNILEVMQDYPALTPDLLALAKWMHVYYAARMESVLEAMIPAAVRDGTRLKEERFLGLARPATPDELVALKKKAPQQARVAEFLAQQFQLVKKSLLLSRLGVTAAVVTALVKRGLVREEVRHVERVAYADNWSGGEVVTGLPPKLNPEQTAVVDSVGESLTKGKFAVHLLHGVTGSGKTEVYLRAVEQVLAAGGSAIYLVPEVALTPQTVSRLRGRFEAAGHQTVVWHSHLGEGERLDGWTALASGKARVVVGARSAIFAPVRDLRLIVVDEEHEPAYKQDETPRYHGRDVAVYRAKLAGATCLLGSATPSLESFANVKSGKYRLDVLTKRVDDKKMPDIQIVDMRIEVMRQRGLVTLSRLLVNHMQARFERREQTILFINRRGYSSSMQCRKCGHVEQCPHCSVAMTYHRADETLKCHLCGHQRGSPAVCPSCAAPDIRWRGLGTQRVEEAVRRVLPRARMERMDTDTMSKKHRFREILSEFRAGKIDVLIGTQMIGKGLDFPNVTLVGLVDADLSMHVPDFRANERTFQLLVQVAGRAGRGDRSGEVVVQTFTPKADAIQYAKRADFDGFAEVELGVRKQFQYPPYRHLIHHLFRGKNPEKIKFYAEHWVKQVEKALGSAVEMRGPTPSPIEKVKDEYRYQIWYFCARATKVVPELVRLQAEMKWPDDVTQILDVDAMSLM